MQAKSTIKQGKIHPLIKLRTLMQSRMANWSLAVLLGFITLLAGATLLALSGWFISAAALAGLTSVAAYGFDYFRPAAIIRLCAIGRTAGRYAERLTSHYAALGLLKDLRVKSFKALAEQAPSRHGSAQLLQRLVADIDLLDLFPLKVITPWLWASLLSLLVILFWYLLAPSLAFYAAIPLAAAWLAVPFFTLMAGIKLAKQDTDLAGIRRQQLLEPLAMMTPLLLWQRWQEAALRFNNTDSRYLRLQLKQQQLSSLASLVQQLLLALSLVGLLWQGIILVAAAKLTVPLLLAAVLALWALSEALTPLCQSFIALGLSMAARDRLNQLAQETANCAIATTIPTGPWQLTVKQLSARQDGALTGPNNISFNLRTGQVLHISGASGCGKSTLLQVLANQLQYSGELLLNNQSYNTWQLADVIGYLPQQLDIFDLSLAQNLRLGTPEASDEQLWQVLADVDLTSWVKAQPEQLNTPLGEYGAQVSGGQARRIALARLLLTQRPILLLDEPFAGLDQASLDKVLASLIRRQQQGLLIIVSHQPLNLASILPLQL
ncbi:thiol reductant ABC exporter subunit CydC [Rheinheimera sp. WS51]|uniref:thiol reductant ABC exporter subunit CydC n=1 Tax=Rheinheimera sp. WS51 TaxID=3425886 RepID=UPI003D94DFA1